MANGDESYFRFGSGLGQTYGVRDYAHFVRVLMEHVNVYQAGDRPLLGMTIGCSVTLLGEIESRFARATLSHLAVTV
jgi:hypothetical protein